MNTPSVILDRTLLKKDGLRSVLHPWIYASAVKSLDGNPGAGDIVAVREPNGTFIAFGHYSPQSRIRIRLLSGKESEFPDSKWFFSKLETSFGLRKSYLEKNASSNSCRLVFGESDGLPGLVVDKYGSILVAQFLTCGMDRIKEMIAVAALEISGATVFYERGDCEIRKLEGLGDSSGIIAGKPIPDDGDFHVAENGLLFHMDLFKGQKTGFFLDQRHNRRTVSEFITPGSDVLDCFSYTGGFGIYAAKAGAGSVTMLDESESALAIARKNMALNNLDSSKAELIAGDAFSVLREFRDRGRQFDFIILDPPKFAPTKATLPRAERAYKDINLLAMKLLRKGGMLATFSCSSGMDRENFRKVLQWASGDAGRDVQILWNFSQPPDHPVRLNFPESEYLKGFLCRVL
jgi:23S rRNA (cytosine1962-C5)-methyltransferase